MSRKRIRTMTLKQLNKIKSQTDWARVDATPDEELDYSEIPEADDEFFKNAVLMVPAENRKATKREIEIFKKKTRECLSL